MICYVGQCGKALQKKITIITVTSQWAWWRLKLPAPQLFAQPFSTDQRKHKGSASLAFVRAIHWLSVESPYIVPVTRKMFPSWFHSLYFHPASVKYLVFDLRHACICVNMYPIIVVHLSFPSVQLGKWRTYISYSLNVNENLSIASSGPQSTRLFFFWFFLVYIPVA